MICTDTDNYVNVNYKERNQKPAFLKLPIYSTELATVTFFFFLKNTVLNAQKHLQRFYSFIVNVLIGQFLNSSCSFNLALNIKNKKYVYFKKSIIKLNDISPGLINVLKEEYIGINTYHINYHFLIVILN